jgi:hypothetical protein
LVQEIDCSALHPSLVDKSDTAQRNIVDLGVLRLHEIDLSAVEKNTFLQSKQPLQNVWVDAIHCGFLDLIHEEVIDGG